MENQMTEFKLTDDKISTIKEMYAKNSTKTEFEVFITLSQRYQLDPMLKEIYFLKFNGTATFMTSRDGYLAIANRCPEFNGMEGDAVYEGDILTRRSDGSLLIEYGENHLKFDKTKITGAYCNVYRKDRDKCSTMLVSFKDYYKETQIWKSYPNAMILKVAEAMALKRAFSISGLVTSEELGETSEKPKTIEEETAKTNAIDVKAEGEANPINESQTIELKNAIKKAQYPSQLYSQILEMFEIKDLSQLYTSEIDQVKSFIKSKELKSE